MVADITVFNPDTITDNATYTLGEQGLPTTGIPHVLVDGQIVVKDSEDVTATWLERRVIANTGHPSIPMQASE